MTHLSYYQFKQSDTQNLVTNKQTNKPKQKSTTDSQE